MLKITYETDSEDFAQVFVGELSDGSRVEFVDSMQPPLPRTTNHQSPITNH